MSPIKLSIICSAMTKSKEIKLWWSLFLQIFFWSCLIFVHTSWTSFRPIVFSDNVQVEAENQTFIFCMVLNTIDYSSSYFVKFEALSPPLEDMSFLFVFWLQTLIKFNFHLTSRTVVNLLSGKGWMYRVLSKYGHFVNIYCGISGDSDRKCITYFIKIQIQY